MKGPGCVSCVNPLMGKTRVDHGGIGTSESEVRELSKMLGVATVAAMKEMRHIIKHV